MSTTTSQLLASAVLAAALAIGAVPSPGDEPQKTAAPPQTMFVQDTALLGQWDTWLYYHEGTYYLFILAGPSGKPNGIGMATSPDGVHWTPRGLVLRMEPGVTWLGTGSTWKSPGYENDKKFFLNFSEWRGDRQTIFFAESTDLLHWRRLGREHEFKQDARWYKPKGRWDCIYTIPRPGGGLYGYWTAEPKDRPGVGFGRSADGIRWEALPSPLFLDRAPQGECGAIEALGNRYYMMLGAGGMVTFVADRPEGPFRPAKKNYRLLGGNTYFSRFFPTPDGILVNHHAWGVGGVYFAPLKQAVVDDEGTLRLKWWKGNERLKHRPVEVYPPQAGAAAVALLGNTFDLKDGLILAGTLDLPASKEQKPAGLFIEHGRSGGTAILVGPGGVTEIGPMKADGTAFKAKDRVDRQLSPGRTAKFRLLVKYSLTEFYLDDHLIQCWDVGVSPTGRIGLIGAGAGEVRAWQ